MLHSANQEYELEQNSLCQSKLLSWDGRNNRIHLWQQNVKSWDVFHFGSKAGMYFIAGTANHIEKWE